MKSILLFAFAFASSFCIAQDVSSFLPMNNLLDINPSFAGSNGGFRVQGNYINIWPSLSGRYTSSILIADMSVNKGKSGISIYANRTNSNHGAFLSNNIGAGYAHRFSVKNGDIFLVPSAQVGVVNARVDVNSLSFHYTPGAINPAILSKTNFEVNTGFLVQIKKKLTIGYAGYHINTPDVGVVGPAKLGLRSVVHASYNFLNADDCVINVFGSYTYQYAFDNLTLACSAVLKKHFYAVLSGRHQTFYNDFTLGFGWRGDFWTATLAYNQTYDKYNNSGTGSYQLACAWSIRGKEHIHGISALENW